MKNRKIYQSNQIVVSCLNVIIVFYNTCNYCINYVNSDILLKDIKIFYII